MRSGFFNPNSQLAYDLFMQDRQRYFGTAEGSFTPDNPFRMGGGGGGGGYYRPPRAGVRQDWTPDRWTYNPDWSRPVIIPAIGNVARTVGSAVGGLASGQGPLAQFGAATQNATGQRPSYEARLSGWGQRRIEGFTNSRTVERIARVADSRAQRRAQRDSQDSEGMI